MRLEEVMEKLNETSFDELTKVMSIRPAFVTMPCFQSSNITHLKTVLKEVYIHKYYYKIVNKVMLLKYIERN